MFNPSIQKIWNYSIKKRNGFLKKHDDKKFIQINWNHYNNVLNKRKSLNIKSFWNIDKIPQNRTYDSIPKHKMFDFLRKAFDECEWTKIKKFKFRIPNSQKSYCIDNIYWDYDTCGYVLKAYYHLCDPNKKHFYSMTIKNVNCFEIFDYVIKIKNIEILETYD